MNGDNHIPPSARPRPGEESDRLVHDPAAGIERLLEIMRRLRDPARGCPWDIAQDFSTIAPYTIEEAYEVADAIERQAWDELPGELGDLLLQVVYHAQMAAERGWFDFDEVVRRVADKMVERHPHVFGEETVEGAQAQTRNWEQRKAAERAAAGRPGVLDGVALALPALTRAVKLQRRAARVGFDWAEPRAVADKICEEARELAEARAGGDPAAVEEELGDLLFAVANLGRHLEVDPERALARANAKFERRFREIERRLAAEGRRPEELGLEELERHWRAVKEAEGTNPD